MHRKIIDQVGTSDPTVFTQYDYASASSAQGAGQDRVSKLVRTGTATTPIYERTIYIDGVFEYVILEDTSGTYEKNYIHIMDDKSRIAEVRIGTPFPVDITEDITYTLDNNIGSSVVRLDINGSVIDREEYYPFGDSSLRTFTYKRYRYVGKERDQESGLYYYGARYYAAWTCRFISVDPLAAQYNQLTPYQNAGNNPINDFDIDGMQSGKTQQAGNSSGGDNRSAAQPDNTVTKTIDVNQDAFQADLDASKQTGFPLSKITEGKKIQKAIEENGKNNLKAEVYGKEDPRFWMTKENYNPEMANYVATQKAMGEQTSAFMYFSVWFNGIGSPMIANFGVGEKTTAQPKIVSGKIDFNKLTYSPGTSVNNQKSNTNTLVNPINRNPFSGLSFVEQNRLAEKMTGDILSKEFPKNKFIILTQQKLKFNDISGGPIFDFLITDLNGSPVGIVDSKGVSGSFTGTQRQFVFGKESATIKNIGGRFHGIGVNPAKIFIQTYNWNRQSGNFTIGFH